MTKGKRWVPEEEKRLRQLLQEGKSVRAIAKSFGKTRDCVRMKIARLEVVVQPESQRTTTTELILPLELPTVEDELKVLSAALKALKAKPEVPCPACGYNMEKAVHVGKKRIPKNVSDEAYASLFLDDEFDDAGDPNYICKGGGRFD